MEKCYLIIDKIDKNKISDSISLSYEERFLRRKKLTSDNGLEFLVNLAETKSLSQNQAFKLDNDESSKISTKFWCRFGRSVQYILQTLVFQIRDIVTFVIILIDNSYSSN